jgi:signal transduction histidine kinase
LLRGIAQWDRRLGRLGIGAIALGFLALLATGLTAYLSVQENQFHSRWVNHSLEVERAITDFLAGIDRAEIGRRGYLLTGVAAHAETYYDARQHLFPSLARIRDLTRDNPRQQANVARLIALTRSDLPFMDQSVALVRSGRRDEAVRLFRDSVGRRAITVLRAQATVMIDEENRLLAIRDAASAGWIRLFYVTIAAAGAILLLVGTGSIWIIARYTRDLTASRDELRLLNTDLEGAVRERTTDLQRANDEIQRFAYIVSHDLRSPLVNVMGFTAELDSAAKALGAMMDKVEQQAPQLVDRAAREALREDIPEALSFIRTSTEKMDRLINAILRLSREGRREITPEKLDMDALIWSLADVHRHRIDARDIDLSIAPNLPDIVSDRLAVEQIFGNLIDNAVKYMVPGRRGRIEIRGRLEARRAIFEIADNGRGIDKRDHHRIFDLFRRSGMQDQQGEGIGLAHVRAIAYRLGGMISVDSELGRGATFRIDLPIEFSGENRILE